MQVVEAAGDVGGTWYWNRYPGARFLIMATGCVSEPKRPDIPGAERFRGEVYTTGRWPHEDVDFTGKRVAVIGTGSSGISSP